MIPYGRQFIDDQDIAAVVKVLQSPTLTQGPFVTALEDDLKKRLNVPYCQAVNSATAGLHIAYLSLGLKPGERVLVTSISFAATANAILYAGAIPEFVDVDPLTGNINLDHVEKILAQAPRGHYRGLAVVHMGGRSVDMQRASLIAQSHQLWLVEDASHAIGGSYKNTAIGECRYSDATVFSFHPVKHIACGEGGAVTTRSVDTHNKLKLFYSHGITKNHDLSAFKEPWEYDMLELGFNYRMPDINAALGSSQLKKLDWSIQRRREIAARYNRELQGLPLTTPPPDEGHAYHLYMIQTDRRKELYLHLRENQIFSQVHYLPIYRLSYHAKRLPEQFTLPGAEAYYKKTLSLPMYPSLTDSEQEFVIEQIQKFFK